MRSFFTQLWLGHRAGLLAGALLLAGAGAAQAQVGSVGIGTTGAPDASAALEVKSTTKGFLPPRITKAMRDAIVSPPSGLLITQTDNTPGLYQYLTGLGWFSLGTLNTESMATLAAPTTAVNLTPATTTVVYTTNGSTTIGSVTLQSGAEGQVGEIIMADFNFAPRGYARCDGHLLPISQNTALFSILGT